MVFYDRYNDFMVFESPNGKFRLVLQLLFAILDYNRQLDPSEEQQFLCFFEPLLQRQAAATRIQQAYRAYKFRNSYSRGQVIPSGPGGELRAVTQQLPIYEIIQKRAAYSIQTWWSNIKLQKRIKAFTSIRAHAMQIDSPELYIEQTLYQQIEHVVSTAAMGFRFVEQSIMFDFNPTSFGIHMQVEEDPDY
jgi:hypothetical protein